MWTAIMEIKKKCIEQGSQNFQLKDTHNENWRIYQSKHCGKNNKDTNPNNGMQELLLTVKFDPQILILYSD